MVVLKGLFKKLKEDSMIRDSFILLVATMIMNLSGFLYHLVMGRLLEPTNYGVLGVALSLFQILLVPLYVIQTSISKFVAEFNTRKDKKSIDNLFVRSIKKLLIVSIIVIILTVSVSFIFANYFKMPILVVWLVIAAIPFMLLLPITRGILQGTQSFSKLGWNFIVEALSKFIFGIVFVFIGLGIFGAIFGIVISYMLAFIFGFLVIKKYYKINKKKLDTKRIYRYSWPVFIVLLTLTLFYSLDIFFIKHYFDELTTGYYTAFAILGRIAFFASFSIVFVLFPKVVERQELGKSNMGLLKKALFLVTIICGAVVLVYTFFPKLVVLILFGSKYLSITKYIAIFAIKMSLFSYVYVLSFYNLSINRTGFIYYLLILNILETALIIKFHSNVWQIIITLLILISITLIFMLIYTFTKNEKNINSNTSIQ